MKATIRLVGRILSHHFSLLFSLFRDREIIRDICQPSMHRWPYQHLTGRYLRNPLIGWARQHAAPLKFDPKPSQAAFSAFFRTSENVDRK